VTGPGAASERQGLWASSADWIAAAGLFAMMMVTVVDVVGRYLFRAPLMASFELTEYLMGLLVFLALPLVSLRGDHIRIGLIDRFLGEGVTRVRDRAIGLLAGAVCGVLAWRVIVLAGRIAAYGDGTQTLRIPLAPLAYFVGASLALSGALLVLRPFLRR
jgi:TRAP-type C4-dicarboxylate transport system permease small subunit